LTNPAPHRSARISGSQGKNTRIFPRFERLALGEVSNRAKNDAVPRQSDVKKQRNGREKKSVSKETVPEVCPGMNYGEKESYEKNVLEG
jgi:hypothetical protein